MSDYKFKEFVPFTQRANNFPQNVVRIHRTGITIAANIMEQSHRTRFVNDNGQERMRMSFLVDKQKKALVLVPNMNGYTVQVRESGNGYLNTKRVKNFGLPVGDYLWDETEDVFRLAK